ncbi:MAG: PAS domain S-box protein [Pseudomonadota bacterium]
MQELELNLDQYRALFANMTEGFALGEIVRAAEGRPVDFQLLLANDAFYRQTGLAPGILGRPARDYLPQLEQSWIEKFSQVALTGRSVRFENFNADTQRQYELYSYCPEPGRFAILCQDISERLRIDQALHERELELRQVLGGLPGMVWTATAAGDTDYHSPQWQAFTGAAPEQLLGSGWSSVLHPEDRPRAQEAWASASATGGHYAIEYRIRRHDGNYRWFKAEGVPLRDEEGQILRWFGICTDIDEQKRTQQALAESRRYYTALFNNRINGIAHQRIVTNADGVPIDYRFEAVNEAYEEIIGLPRQAVVGKLVTEVFPGIRALDFDFIAEFGEVALRGSEWRKEIYFSPIRKWLAIYAYCPRPGECVAIFSDITAQKEAEQALRATFEEAGVGIVHVVPDGKLIRANRTFCAMIGYDEEELKKMDVRELVYPPDLRTGREHRERAVSGASASYSIEQRYRRKDGQLIWVRITGAPVRDPASRQVLYCVDILEDITEPKRARAELEGFFRQASVGMLVMDLESNILRVNRRFRDILGFSEEELKTTPYMALNHPDDLPLDKTLFARLVADEIPEYTMEKRLLCKDGNFVWTLISATLVRDEPDARPYVVSIIQDIEARKQLEQDLLHSQRGLEARVDRRTQELRLAQWQAEEALREAETANAAKSSFLATMSHEIRTPLNGVIGFTGLLLEGPLPEQKRRYAELARQSGEALLHLLNDFLDFSKIEAGRLELEPVDFDLHQELQQVLALVEHGAEEKGLALKKIITVPHRFRGDAARLRQILLNLLSNAVKFTEHGHITLCCTEKCRRDTTVRLCFEVADTGIGINPDTRTRLFQPFTQGSSISRRYGGTGLGLAICRRLTDIMGGSIDFRSTPGEGTTFWVELPFEILPAADEPLPTAVDDVLAAAPDHLRQGRVLVAEDNSVSQLLATEVLRRLGYQVDAVSNGREAVEACRRLPYDLILMDCDMPVMDGFEATRHIRALEAGSGRRVPIIAMTAAALQGDPERCIAAGMDEFMSKPLRLQQLSQVIQAWLRRTKRQETGSTEGADREPRLPDPGEPPNDRRRRKG